MLKPNKLKMLSTDEIKPTGWLARQLEIQANGLSGNLDKIWPDIKDSKWIGGEQEGWERVPYWLDGFIPLAYLIDNDDMKARANKYIDAIISGQKEDGWICPCADNERQHYDVWAAFLIGKVLTVYYDCTKDERIEQVIYRMLKNLNKHLNHTTLFNWAAARWYECLIPIYWLYERTPEEWLIDLADKLAVQGIDYKLLSNRMKFKKKKEKRYWNYLYHVVNVAMALKSDGLYARITGKNAGKFAKQMLAQLMKNHGTAVGHFSGDECLAGLSPIQGTECCGVVEAMYSYEQLLSLTADHFWADRLEMLAYNALPATISPDMCSHQYDQLVNQVECSILPRDQVHFTSNSGESHLFGLEPNFGCCTANFNQGWPKFALSTFMLSENGLTATVLAPSKVNLKIQNVQVECELITNYPFDEKLKFIISTKQPIEFSFDIRIPSFVKSATVDGKKAQPGTYFKITREWMDKTEICVEFDITTEFVKRPNNMVAVKRGGLMYSIKIAEQWEMIDWNAKNKKNIERNYPFCDYEIKPLSAWNFGYVSEDFKIEKNPISEIPFSPDKAPIVLKTKAVKIPWSIKNGICSETPENLIPISNVQEIILIPYGCSNIRMTEVPYIDISKK